MGGRTQNVARFSSIIVSMPDIETPETTVPTGLRGHLTRYNPKAAAHLLQLILYAAFDGMYSQRAGRNGAPADRVPQPRPQLGRLTAGGAGAVADVDFDLPGSRKASSTPRIPANR